MSLGQPPSDQAVVNLRSQQSIVTPHLVSGVGSFHNVNTELINGLPVGNRYGYLPYYFRQAATASGLAPLFTLDVGVNTIGWDKLVSPNLLVQSNGIPEILESPAPNAPWTVTQPGIYMIDANFRISAQGNLFQYYPISLQVLKNDTIICDNLVGINLYGNDTYGSPVEASCSILLPMIPTDTLLFAIQRDPLNVSNTVGVKVAQVRIIKIA